MRETSRHRQALNLYWDLGPERSLVGLRHKLLTLGHAPSLRTLGTWSSHLGWQERIARIEREARAADDAVRVREQCAFLKRKKTFGIFLQQKGYAGLEEKRPDQLSAATSLRLIVDGLREEGAAFGTPTGEDIDVEAEVTAFAAKLGLDRDKLLGVFRQIQEQA